MLFKKPKQIEYPRIISLLEKGDPIELQQLLWHPKKGKVEYLPVTTSLIQKLKKVESNNGKLAVHQVFHSKNFELVIFNIPWSDSDVPFSPLIFHKESETIIGIMLPFNELHGLLSTSYNKEVSELSSEWLKFVIPFRFK